jgi:hypothetical protein
MASYKPRTTRYNGIYHSFKSSILERGAKGMRKNCLKPANGYLKTAVFLLQDLTLPMTANKIPFQPYRIAQGSETGAAQAEFSVFTYFFPIKMLF